MFMIRFPPNLLWWPALRLGILVALCISAGCSSVGGNPFVARRLTDPPGLSPFAQPLNSGTSGAVQLSPSIEPLPADPYGPSADPDGFLSEESVPLVGGPAFANPLAIDDETTVRQRLGVPGGNDPLRAPDRLSGESDSASPDLLTLDVVGPELVTLGQPIDLVIHIGQRHTETLDDLQIECALDDGLQYPGASERAFRQRLGSFASGEKREIDLSLIASEPGEHCIEFRLTADGSAPAETTHCVVTITESLGLNISGPEQRTAGSTAEYVITLVNPTGRDVADVRIDLSYDSILTPQEASTGAIQEPGRMSWVLGVLRAQERVEIQVEFACPRPTHETCLVVEATSAGFSPQNRRKCLQIDEEGDLSVHIENDREVIRSGEPIAYSVRIQNRGLDPVVNVRLLADLSEHLLLTGVGVEDPVQNRQLPALPVKHSVGPPQMPVIPLIPPDGIVTVRLTAIARYRGVALVQARVSDATRQIAVDEFTVILPSE